MGEEGVDRDQGGGISLLLQPNPPVATAKCGDRVEGCVVHQGSAAGDGQTVVLLVDAARLGHG